MLRQEPPGPWWNQGPHPRYVMLRNAENWLNEESYQGESDSMLSWDKRNLFTLLEAIWGRRRQGRRWKPCWEQDVWRSKSSFLIGQFRLHPFCCSFFSPPSSTPSLVRSPPSSPHPSSKSWVPFKASQQLLPAEAFAFVWLLRKPPLLQPDIITKRLYILIIYNTTGTRNLTNGVHENRNLTRGGKFWRCD